MLFFSLYCFLLLVLPSQPLASPSQCEVCLITKNRKLLLTVWSYQAVHCSEGFCALFHYAMAKSRSYCPGESRKQKRPHKPRKVWFEVDVHVILSACSAFKLVIICLQFPNLR